MPYFLVSLNISFHPFFINAIFVGSSYVISLPHTVSNLVRDGQFSYAPVWARVDADCPTRDSGWDHFVDRSLQELLA